MNQIFVYKIYSTFRKPGMKGFFVEEEKSNCIDFNAIFALDFLIYHLYNKLDQLNYVGDRKEYCSYLGGYFGKPAIPLDSYLLRRLNKKEINNLEKEIKKYIKIRDKINL